MTRGDRWTINERMSLTVEQAMALALAHHQSGRVVEAESIYRQVLSAAPLHPDALHLLGVLEHLAGRSAIAAELIHKAIQVRPSYAPAYNNLGNVLKDQRQ